MQFSCKGTRRTKKSEKIITDKDYANVNSVITSSQINGLICNLFLNMYFKK